MSNASESSVLFNLRELMDLEQDRVRAEAEAARRAELEAAARRRAEAARRAAEEEARLRAEEAAREAAERAAREEEERIARERREHELRLAAELEAKARAAENAQRFEHERALAAIEAQKKRGVPAWVFGVAALLVAGAGAGVYFGVVVPAEQERNELAARIEGLQSRSADIDRLLAAGEATADELARLRAERDRIREELLRQQTATPAPTEAHVTRPTGVRPPRPQPTATPPVRDCRGPLGCLQRR